MIEREGSDWVVHCDSCFDASEYDREELDHQFHRLIEALRADGWLIEYCEDEGGEWTHVCPRCAEIEISRSPGLF